MTWVGTDWLLWSSDSKTPNLDAMAENGLHMDRFYTGAPSCTPTRASVVTGRTNDRTGAFRLVVISINRKKCFQPHLKMRDILLHILLSGI